MVFSAKIAYSVRHTSVKNSMLNYVSYVVAWTKCLLKIVGMMRNNRKM